MILVSSSPKVMTLIIVHQLGRSVEKCETDTKVDDSPTLALYMMDLFLEQLRDFSEIFTTHHVAQEMAAEKHTT